MRSETNLRGWPGSVDGGWTVVVFVLAAGCGDADWLACNVHSVCNERVGHPVRVCTYDFRSGAYRGGLVYWSSIYLA